MSRYQDGSVLVMSQLVANGGVLASIVLAECGIGQNAAICGLQGKCGRLCQQPVGEAEQ